MSSKDDDAMRLKMMEVFLRNIDGLICFVKVQTCPSIKKTEQSSSNEDKIKSFYDSTRFLSPYDNLIDSNIPRITSHMRRNINLRLLHDAIEGDYS